MNIRQTIRKVLREETLPSTASELIKSLPERLKKLFFNQWKAKQNPKWHPEGNTLKHIIVVVKRAYEHYPNDPNMIMAALFHDLGKMDTYKINPKTGQPTAYGHEDVSTNYVEEFKDWIESFDGTDVDEIKYLVKNHMKVKPSTWDAMKDTKKEPIQKHPAFDKLMGFTDNLDGGGTELRKSIKDGNINESTDTEYAVIEITKPSSRIPQKWYFQAVPLNRTKQDKIYIKRGSAGTLTISTDNIKIHKIFKKSEKEEIDKYLEKLRDEGKKIEESVIKEETSVPIRLIRRIHNVDELLELKLRIHFGPDSVCKYESDEEFLEVISDSVINTMYWDYFGDIDDDSEEWKKMFRTMEKYIEDKYGEKLKKYYQKHCSKKVETNESELTEKCWKGYTQKGMKTMFGKRYPNCVKKTK